MVTQKDLVPVPGIENVSQEFKDKVVQIANDLGTDPNYLMAVMSFETDSTFSPSMQNYAGSGAVGLIQFLPSTAASLGTSADELGQMSAEAQLDFVAKYLEPYKGKLNTLEDTYMAVFTPAAIGKGKEHVLYEQGTTAYRQNNGLDSDQDGKITVGEATQKVRDRLEQGWSRQQSQAESLIQGPSSQSAQPVFKHSVPERQLDASNYPAFDSTVIGSGYFTGGFFEPDGHGQKSFTTKYIAGDTPDEVQTKAPGRYNIGVDYVVSDNQVKALYGGTVIKAGNEGGYGNRIHVQTDLTYQFQGQEYPLYAAYAHLAEIDVKPGQAIEQGEHIGIQGNTGASSGPHVDLATWIEVNGEKIYVSPNAIDKQLTQQRQQTGIDATLKATAVTDAAQTILTHLGKDTAAGREFQGNTYSFSQQEGELSVTKGEAEILRVENGAVTVNQLSDRDLSNLSRVAYALDYERHPNINGLSDPGLTALTLANVARTVAELDPRSSREAGAYSLQGYDYNIEQRGNDLHVEAKDGRGTILEIQDGRVHLNRATVQDVAVLSRTSFAHSQQATMSSPAQGQATLRSGDRGEAVRSLQTQLTELGYLKGDIDGQFGPETTAAVKDFQREHNLEPDGIVGPKTWQSLDEVNQQQSAPSPQTPSLPPDSYLRTAQYVQDSLQRPVSGAELDTYVALAVLNGTQSAEMAAQVVSQGPQAQALQQNPEKAQHYVQTCLEQASQLAEPSPQAEPELG
ncbi:MAG: peptidoglycan-binding protein [Cyanophyceae cyanobacterium]